jgi:carboxymethylenebutenolidase
LSSYCAAFDLRHFQKPSLSRLECKRRGAVLIAGSGRKQVNEFYHKYFLPQIPADMETIPVSRTIGQGRVVDEMVIRFTHTIPMDWMLPGIPPTGKRIEIALVVVVQFDGDRLSHEHL